MARTTCRHCGCSLDHWGYCSNVQTWCPYVDRLQQGSPPGPRYLIAAAASMGDLPIGSYDHGRDDAASD